MIERARRRHPECRFLEGDAHAPELSEQFDFIICSDLLNDVWDVQRVLEQAALLSHPSTRVIINTYSRVWELPRRIAETRGDCQTNAAAKLAHHRRHRQSFVSGRFRGSAVLGGNRLADPHAAAGYSVQQVCGATVAIRLVRDGEFPDRAPAAEAGALRSRSGGERDCARAQRGREHTEHL